MQVDTLEAPDRDTALFPEVNIFLSVGIRKNFSVDVSSNTQLEVMNIK